MADISITDMFEICQKKRFSCTQCSVVCTTRYGLREHLRRHTGDKPFTCNQCNQHFKRMMGLRKHQQFVHGAPGSKQFNCPKCKVTSNNLGNVVRHYMAVHRGSRRFICSICLARYSQHQELRIHLRSKHDFLTENINSQEKKPVNEVYILPPFDSEIVSESLLKRCQEVVEEEKGKLQGLDKLVDSIKTNCGVEKEVGENVDDPPEMNISITSYKATHIAEPAERDQENCKVDCDKYEQRNQPAVPGLPQSCPETWISVVVLEKPVVVCNDDDTTTKNIIDIQDTDNCRPEENEMQTVIQGSKSKWKCKNCDKVFIKEKKLMRHLKIHNDNKSYKCNVCDKVFREQHNLSVHYRSHTGDRPYICSICKKKFRYHKDITDHMVTHTKEKKYACNFCDKTFIRKRDCHRHKLLHNPECRFKCNDCGKGFSRRYLWQSHLVKHQESGKERVKHIFECDVCRKIYKTLQGFLQHRNKHTGMIDHQCHICSKSFVSANKLQCHLRNHIPRVKNVACSKCQRKFSSQDTLKIHVNRFHKTESVAPEHIILNTVDIPNYDLEIIIDETGTLVDQYAR